MCTVTWAHRSDGDGFELLCNRDEASSREMAFTPGVGVRNGVRYVAPVDGRHGGTWIAANEFGVALCLTNGVRGGHGAKAPAMQSRGLLVLDWIDSVSTLHLMDRAAAADLSRYAPFTMAVLEPGAGTAILEWDGASRQLYPRGDWFLPLSSSSAEPDAALLARRHLFEKMRPADAASLYRFHESHDPAPGALSCCMHRTGARTVSFSWLRVDECSVNLFYSPGAPCQWREGAHTTLPRVS